MIIRCEVFKSSKQADTYRYLPLRKDQAELPEGLLNLLGEISCFLTIELTENKKLAQANAADVMKSIDDDGCYLQMPPNDNIHVAENQTQ